MKPLFLLLNLPLAVYAFTISNTVLTPSPSSSTAGGGRGRGRTPPKQQPFTSTCRTTSTPRTPSISSRIYAESGPPQYDKIDATLRQVDILGDGSTAMLHIEADTKIDYKAGHVLALEIDGASSSTSSSTSSSSEKNQTDAVENGGWMRGPYTVSRATGEQSFDVLIKVVGDKSRTFASAQPGTPVRFGGKFKVPIVDGINMDDTKRVVFLSTGVGIGPCIGAIEEAMKVNDDSLP